MVENTINHQKRAFQILEKCYFYTIIELEICKKTEIFILEKCILFTAYACVLVKYRIFVPTNTS